MLVLIRWMQLWWSWLEGCFKQAAQPAPYALAAGAAMDVARSKAQLLAENALLRQQVIILKREVKHPN